MLALNALKNAGNKEKTGLDVAHNIKPLSQCQQELRELGMSDSEIAELGSIIKKLNENLVKEKLIQPLL